MPNSDRITSLVEESSCEKAAKGDETVENLADLGRAHLGDGEGRYLK